MGDHSECKHCKTWDEEIYWNHFNSMQFFLTLPQNFYDHLVLPEKFAAHMKAQLPDKVSLKSPSGAIWEIDLLKSDNLLFVGDEWKAFVKANDVNENCILMFKYKRNSSFEVFVFDQGSSCEKESSYFVKKCSHAKSDTEDLKKRTEREASSTKVIEDESEKDSAFVASKKSRKDDGPVVCSEGKVKYQTPRKQVLSAAAIRRGRPRRVLPRKSTTRSNTQSNLAGKKSTCHETAKELSQDLDRDVITPENGENFPQKDHAQKLESLSKKGLNGDEAAKELTAPESAEPDSGENTPENGKKSPAADHSHNLKGQSEKQPSRFVAASATEPTEISERILPENGEFLVIDHSLVKAQSDKSPSKNDTIKEVNQNIEKELITPEKEKDPRENGTVKKVNQSSRRDATRLDYREISEEEDHSGKSRGKRGRPKKEELPKSSKKLVFKSGGKRFSKEYMSNRRPVTQMEKQDALQRADKKLTENSFLVIMRPTSVYKRFFLSVPADWLDKHLHGGNQEVVLRVGERTWKASLCFYGKRGGGLSTGWKTFALENFLEEFDVLVFHLVSQKGEAAVMDVDVVRVVSKIAPPLPVV